MDMTVTEIDGPVTLVRLEGRLDAAGADHIGLRFTAAIASKDHHALVDLGGVSFVASMGLRLLIATARALHLKGAKLVLFGATPAVQAVFDDAALDQVMPIQPGRDEALAALAS